MVLLLNMSPFQENNHGAQLGISEMALGLMKFLSFDIQVFCSKPLPSPPPFVLRTVWSLRIGGGGEQY